MKKDSAKRKIKKSKKISKKDLEIKEIYLAGCLMNYT